MTFQFDSMLWDLMSSAAQQTHHSLEPMYSTVDPNLPTFHSAKWDDDDDDEPKFVRRNGAYVEITKTKDSTAESLAASMTSRMTTILASSGSMVKSLLRKENNDRATTKKYFLPDQRTSMITDRETDRILQRSFEYIVSLMEFNLVILKFEMNHYLYEGFKEKLKSSFSRTLSNDTDWAKLVEPDSEAEERLCELEEQIGGLQESLHEVQQLQRKF